MKTKLTLLALLISAITIAQNGINYKAIIKDSDGNVVANDLVTVEFTILQGVAQTSVYQETHTPTTDANGIIIINIGEGTTSDVFANIDWSVDDHFLNVQVNTGSGLTDLGTTQFMHVPYAIQAERATTANNVTGLEAIDEGNGIGWRLVGRNPDFHGDIGLGAIDLNQSNIVSSSIGATGNYALVTGQETIASADNSTALGYRTTAASLSSVAMGSESESRGNFSFAMGNGATTTGESSISMGENTTASGAHSFSIGDRNIASGVAAVAMGSETIASGFFSTAMGQSTEASGSLSTAIGQNTIASGSYSLSSGRNNLSSGEVSITLGANTEAIGSHSIAIGRDVLASGTYSKAFGNSVSSRSGYEIVVGLGNTDYTPISQYGWAGSDRLFVIGNGGYEISGGDLVFQRSNAMVVLKNGNIGLGTNTPDEILHIQGRLKIGTETIEDTGNNRLSFNANILPDNDNAMTLGNSNFRWSSLWATDGTINTSDRRNKTNITFLNYGLKEVMELNPVSFNWKTNPNDDTKLGLIAQDLLKIIPEVVKTHDWETDDNGNKIKTELNRMGVYYSDLVPVLIKAIQEQQDIINSQKEINSKQDKQYKALLFRIEYLETEISN